MIKLKIFLILVSLTAIQSFKRPLRRNRQPPPMSKLPSFIDPDFSSQLRIPNKAFCNNMESQPAEPYRVLPWWSDYCQRLREKEERKRLVNGVFDLSPYKRVLDKLKEYRRRPKDPQQL